MGAAHCEPSVEEQYLDWVERLKQAIIDGHGADVHVLAELVADSVSFVSPYYPLLWREGAGGREIIEVLEQARSRVAKDIERKRFSEWYTPELYQAYARNIQTCCEDVRDYLARRSEEYAQLPKLAV